MNFSNLLEPWVQNSEFNLKNDITVQGLALDSRDVAPGYVFFACLGEHVNGVRFIDDAIAQGAVAILVEGETVRVDWKDDVPLVYLPNLYEKAGLIAARFFDEPSHAMQVIGVTGTNGKTSVCYMLAQVLSALGKKTCLIGTLGNGEIHALEKTAFTTPDPIALQYQLAAFRDAQVDVVVMEVSSHALSQGRVNGVAFDYAVFTNLSRDHLDYYKTIETYAEVKRTLFDFPTLKAAILNVDDPYGAAWCQSLEGKLPVFPYSLDKTMTELHFSPLGMQVKFAINNESIALDLPLLGRFNLYNVLAVMTVLQAMQVDLLSMIKPLEAIKPVPGRMEIVKAEGSPTVIIDFAHTPDALEKALRAVRDHSDGELVCVFGCGGDRDTGKRSMMGKIGGQCADQVLITSDNPRSENPLHIAQAILKGVKNKRKANIELSRLRAINKAVTGASENAMVLIAGKGHETTQVIGKKTIPFSDIEIVRQVIERKGK